MKREGRKNNETREIKFIKDYTKHALGSVLVEFGDTRVLTTASVEEGKPKWMTKDDLRGWLTAEYSLLPSAPNTRCQREQMPERKNENFRENSGNSASYRKKPSSMY